MSSMRRIRAFAIVVCLLSASTAAAQLDTATVIGTIVDAQGAVVPGVTVVVRNVDTGFTRAGTTDAEGHYRIAAVPPGRYEITAELQGFSTTTRRGVQLSLGSESVLNFTLQLAGVAENVTVTADTPIVETTTAAVQSAIHRDQIDLLPLISREYTSLLRLVPGAQSSNGTSFTGSRGRSNQWTIDGVDNSEDISGYSRQSPALESVKEVQVLVNGFKAEYGSASGGIVNVVTRSGTNDFHGNGFYLFRNQEMMSMNPYADRALGKDPFQRVHYGGTLGGPIARDRMHFFATYEREDRDTFSDSTITLPTSAQIASAAASTREFLSSHGIGGDLFGDGGRRRLVRPEFVDVHKATLRTDNQFGANQFLTFRYTMDHERDPSGTSGTLLDFNGSTAFFRTNYLNANHKWIVGANKLNELYIQFGQSFGDWKAAYPDLTNISVSGGFSLGGPTNYPQGRTDYVTQVVNNFSWNLVGTRTGEHGIKTGAQMKIFRSNSFFDSNFRGIYTFPTLSAFLQGKPSRFTQNQGDSTLARPNQIYGFYVQDDWRINRSVTLNLGLRYDFEGAKTEALKDVSGAPGPGISGDKNNFAPRFGFAWAPRGSTTQAFYGGTGIYYDQIILNIIGNARFTPPKVIGVQIDAPAWPDPFVGGKTSIPPPNVSIIDPDLHTAYNWNSQVGYRRELMRDVGLDVSVVYNRGYEQVAILNTNALPRGSASIFGTPRAGVTRPDPAFTNKSFYSNLGQIRYTGLLVDLKKRFSRRLQAEVNYTLAKTRDNSFNFVSGFTVPERMDLSWGPGSQDRRHVLRGNTTLVLPFDVQFGLIGEFMTEAPLNITAARDLNGDGLTGDWVNEDICVNVSCPGFHYSRNSAGELTTEQANGLRALFGLSPISRFENNPRYFNADMTLQKRFRIHGDQRFRVTAEAFNVFNIPQRLLGSTSITSGIFGSYDDVSQPRAVQLTMQYDW
jgi:hypothetical protein